MKKFIAINTIIHGGETYLPGAEIEVDAETEAWLDQNNCIKPIEDAEEAAPGNAEVELATLTVAALTELAATEEVNLDGVTKKADIIAAIEAKRAEVAGN